MFSDRTLGNKGNIISADGLLYCYDENGDVGLVRPTPEKFDLISSFEIEEGSGPHWAHPVIADGRFYIRLKNKKYRIPILVDAAKIPAAR